MAKRPTNNTIAMKLTDPEVNALIKVADDHEEKTTTQAKSCLLFGLEMSPIIEMVRQLLKEEGAFTTAVRAIEPNISDEECLRWIQDVLVEAVYAEREALANKTMRFSNIMKGKTPPQGMRIPKLEEIMKKRGQEAANKVIDDAISAAMLSNGWSFDEANVDNWY